MAERAREAEAGANGGRLPPGALAQVFVTLLAVQLATGLLLLSAYAPAATTAWGSVWYIQTQVPYGWLIRGLHVCATDALLVTGAGYLAARLWRGRFGSAEARWWWMGCAALGLVVGLALSGYLLPYDQRAYWGTVVRTHILARTPMVGESLRRLLLGGDAPGTMALTRFCALHVGVLPVAAAALWVLTRRWRGVAAAGGGGAAGRGVIRGMTLLLLIAWVAARHHHLGMVDLDAPADAAATDYPARPEWWALPLFQWLKYFETPAGETFAAIVVPGVAAVLLLLVPVFFGAAEGGGAGANDSGVTVKASKRVGWLRGAMVAAGVAAAGLSAQALRWDRRAESGYAAARARADREGVRARELAGEKGIPPEGAAALLHADPWTRGPKLFAAQCASCHRVHGHNGLGEIPAEAATSSDLGGFGTRGWIRSLLRDPMDPRHFGAMKKADGEPAHTRMRQWIAEQRAAHAEGEAAARLEAEFDAVAAYLEAEGARPGFAADADDAGRTEAVSDGALLRRGREVFVERCQECHSYRGARSGTQAAPEMYGYGSVEWLELMIASPDHETRYRSRGRERALMPPFRDRLSGEEIRMLAEWMYLSREAPAAGVGGSAGK